MKRDCVVSIVALRIVFAHFRRVGFFVASLCYQLLAGVAKGLGHPVAPKTAERVDVEMLRASGAGKTCVWIAYLVVAIATASVASAAHAQCAGTVEVRAWPFLNLVLISGDAEGNCIEIVKNDGILVVTGLDATSVSGSPVDAAGPTTIFAILRQGNDEVWVTGNDYTETRLHVSTDVGNDVIDVGQGFIKRLDIAAGADNDSVDLGSATILEPSSVDGGAGGDRLGLGGTILGAVDLTGFEGLVLPCVLP